MGTDAPRATTLSIQQALDILQLKAAKLEREAESRLHTKWTLHNVAVYAGVAVTAAGITVGVVAEGPSGGAVVAAGTTVFAVLTRLGWQNHAIQAEKRFGDYEYVSCEAAVLRASLSEMQPVDARKRLTELHDVMREARKTFW